MISLTKILYEVLNNYSVEADLFVDPSASHYDITNEIRALRGVTIVTIITPEDYIQKQGADKYMKLRIKFVTREDAQEILQSFLDDTLTNDGGENDVRIQGVKSMKFIDGTLKRL
tara:strand:+ start:869 stop:1213 length:345 start_codon:yes stop_codon:yes gene_type:complete